MSDVHQLHWIRWDRNYWNGWVAFLTRRRLKEGICLSRAAVEDRRGYKKRKRERDGCAGIIGSGRRNRSGGYIMRAKSIGTDEKDY